MTKMPQAKPWATTEQKVGHTTPTGWSHHPGGLEWLGAAGESRAVNLQGFCGQVILPTLRIFISRKEVNISNWGWAARHPQGRGHTPLSGSDSTHTPWPRSYVSFLGLR